MFHFQGLERLIIKKSLSEKLNNQIRKFALGKMRDVNHVIALPAVQLLLSCMYTGMVFCVWCCKKLPSL